MFIVTYARVLVKPLAMKRVFTEDFADQRHSGVAPALHKQQEQGVPACGAPCATLAISRVLRGMYLPYTVTKHVVLYGAGVRGGEGVERVEREWEWEVGCTYSTLGYPSLRR